MNEKALIAAFERVVSTDHANPNRLGCSGISVLQEFVMRPETFARSALLDHLGRCEPCLRELKQLHSDRRNAKEIA